MTIVLTIVLLVIVAVVVMVRPRAPHEVDIEPVHADQADVTVLKIGVDSQTGTFVKNELARVGQGAPKDRLREAGVVLRRVRDAWLYGGAVNEPMRPVPEAMAVFARHVAAAQAAQGDASVVVISVAVVARGELVTVSSVGTGEELRRALEAAAYRDDLLAVEIVTGAGDATGLYPLQGNLAGKAICQNCGGPFPAELVSCPHCGAPAPGRDRTASK